MISLTAEYALRAVVALGANAGTPQTAQQLAMKSLVSTDYLAKVLQSLSRAGLVVSQRGLYGGYSLTRPLDQLSLLDVINAVDPIKRIECCPLGLAEHGVRLCALHQKLDDGIAHLEALFGGITVDQLLREQQSSPTTCQGIARYAVQVQLPGKAPGPARTPSRPTARKKQKRSPTK